VLCGVYDVLDVGCVWCMAVCMLCGMTLYRVCAVGSEWWQGGEEGDGSGVCVCGSERGERGERGLVS
jgi:hypothetical protein